MIKSLVSPTRGCAGLRAGFGATFAIARLGLDPELRMAKSSLTGALKPNTNYSGETLPTARRAHSVTVHFREFMKSSLPHMPRGGRTERHRPSYSAAPEQVARY